VLVDQTNLAAVKLELQATIYSSGEDASTVGAYIEKPDQEQPEARSLVRRAKRHNNFYYG
jgi:hypothetical protein